MSSTKRGWRRGLYSPPILRQTKGLKTGSIPEETPMSMLVVPVGATVRRATLRRGRIPKLWKYSLCSS